MSDSIEFLLAPLAGLATVASPCVLPVLPILLGVSADRPGKRRPLLIVAGFVVSFSAFALALGAVSNAAQLAQETLHDLALALLALSGLLRLWPQPYDWLVAHARPLLEHARPLLARLRGDGGSAPTQSGAFVMGLSLGAVWTPCAGPVLASILALVVQARDPARAALLVTLYAVGAALPMLALIHGGRVVTQRVRVLARNALSMQRLFGLLVLASAAVIYLQYDTLFYARFASFFPTLKGI